MAVNVALGWDYLSPFRGTLSTTFCRSMCYQNAFLEKKTVKRNRLSYFFHNVKIQHDLCYANSQRRICVFGVAHLRHEWKRISILVARFLWNSSDRFLNEGQNSEKVGFSRNPGAQR